MPCLSDRPMDRSIYWETLLNGSRPVPSWKPSHSLRFSFRMPKRFGLLLGTIPRFLLTSGHRRTQRETIYTSAQLQLPESEGFCSSNALGFVLSKRRPSRSEERRVGKK